MSKFQTHKKYFQEFIYSKIRFLEDSIWISKIQDRTFLIEDKKNLIDIIFTKFSDSYKRVFFQLNF